MTMIRFAGSSRVVFVLVPVLVLLLPSINFAEIPQVMSYQGKVTYSAGSPVSDGSYPMRFQIYDAETGGTQLWDSGPQTVALSGGIFSVMLGAGTMPVLNLDFDQDYWLQVFFNYDPQSPRQRLGSVGYAYMASGIVPGTEVSGEVTTWPCATLKATNTATMGTSYGLYGESASSAGVGVYGSASATSGYTCGVYGISSIGGSVNGTGVFGQGNWRGVYGVSTHPTGVGVCGKADATTGVNYGVYGQSSSTEGTGVYGVAMATTGNTCAGVRGHANSPLGVGICGVNYATTGVAPGVYGSTWSTEGYGVYGYAVTSTGQSFGGSFVVNSASGVGAYGAASATTGVTYGLLGEIVSTDGRGVCGRAYGTAGTNYGVYGQSYSTSGTGVCGHASATTGGTRGVYGESSSPSGIGVVGYASATNGIAYGIYGDTNSSSGYGVYYSGGLAGTGTKSCVVKTSQGPRLMYCQESPETWFEDFGEGRLVDGRCHIELDPLFLETVTIDEANPMHVFMQLHDPECEGAAAVRGTNGFDVIERKGGVSDVSFSYRVVAKRKGFEAKRLDVCEAARTDSYLFPELRERELEELEEERARMETELPRREEERRPMQQQLDGAANATPFAGGAFE